MPPGFFFSLAICSTRMPETKGMKTGNRRRAFTRKLPFLPWPASRAFGLRPLVPGSLGNNQKTSAGRNGLHLDPDGPIRMTRTKSRKPRNQNDSIYPKDTKVAHSPPACLWGIRPKTAGSREQSKNICW